jgi:hypothetical protein
MDLKREIVGEIVKLTNFSFELFACQIEVFGLVFEHERFAELDFLEE